MLDVTVTTHARKGPIFSIVRSPSPPEHRLGIASGSASHNRVGHCKRKRLSQPCGALVPPGASSAREGKERRGGGEETGGKKEGTKGGERREGMEGMEGRVETVFLLAFGRSPSLPPSLPPSPPAAQRRSTSLPPSHTHTHTPLLPNVGSKSRGGARPPSSHAPALPLLVCASESRSPDAAAPCAAWPGAIRSSGKYRGGAGEGRRGQRGKDRGGTHRRRPSQARFKWRRMCRRQDTRVCECL